MILHVYLSGALDGLEIVSQLKSSGATAAIPILVISAYHDDNLSYAARQAGPEQFLAKPFLLTKMLNHVERLLESLQTESRQQA